VTKEAKLSKTSNTMRERDDQLSEITAGTLSEGILLKDFL